LYISDTDTKTNRRKSTAKTAFVYLLISLFCILFGAVYELFSHEVYSFYMIYAFVFPLAGGTLPYLFLFISRPRRYPSAFSRNTYNAGIATLTVGSIMNGVLEIYGTTNVLADIYWFAGIPLILAGLISYLAAKTD